MNITGGKFNGRKILTVKSNDVRPTSSKIRGSIFSMLNSLGVDFSEMIFLDLFSGSGIMGLEALSRGAKKSFFIEKNPSVYKLIKQNLEKFDVDAEIFNIDALKFLEKTEQKFDIIFIDPPYHEGFYDSVIVKAKRILNKNGLLIIEAPLEYKLPEGFDILKHKIYGTTQIFIIKF